MNDDPQVHYQRLKQAAEQRIADQKASPIPTITVFTATCGIASGALDTRKAIEDALNEFGLEARIRTVGCLGHCYGEPLVVIDNPEAGFPPIMYQNVQPGKARMLVRYYLGEGDPVFEHVLGATRENDMVPTVMDFPRFNLEKRLVLERCGLIDPESLDEYISEGGYQGLALARSGTPEEVVRLVEASGLRGRGGAGFPTFLKWDLARRAEGEKKLVICNADEGDPGAYMDRTILESNPHQVLEGLAICAHAVGANKALVYIRAEYPLAVTMMKKAIQDAGRANLIGPNAPGSDSGLEVEVFLGSGAFVCGEETALIQSIEGKRGMPSHRPPFPVEKGLFGIPTVINNVKTLATIPPILERGAEWFRGIGTEKSPGTAIFSVVGDVVHPGLVEIPMGVTLRSLIFDVCGGIPKKKKFKAVQIGGPSGGCLPEPFLDTPIDFDSLTQAGAMMGSGGLVVMDEDSCMVDIARYFLDFTQKESCGKCTFCRIGTFHLLEALTRLTQGEALPTDLELLETLSREVREGSLCGLGKTAPNPILTSLKYFAQEYREHLEEGRCSACSCRPLTAYYIDLDKCARGCDACVGCCPVEAVFTTANQKRGIDQDLCVKCGECLDHCPPEYDAVIRISPAHLAPVIPKPVSPVPEA